jgi:hypothetical protein
MKNPLSPRWQSDDPDVRLEAVQSGKLTQDVLQEIAAQDPKLNIKDAAINLIEDPAFLLILANTEPNAGKRWAELTGEDLQQLSAIDGVGENLLLAVAQYAPKEEFRMKAVKSLSEAALCEVLRNDNLSKVHQHCAGAIEREDNLSSLQKLFIDKDKNVSRILKSKLQAIKHARDISAAEALELESLFEKTEALRASEPGPDYGRRIDVLRQAWQNLPDASVEAAKQIQALLEQCDAILAEMPNPEELLQAQLDQIAEQCAELRAECIADPNLDSLSSMLKGIMNSWPDEADLAARDQLTADLVALETAQKAWQEFIAIGTNQTLDQFEEALADLSWPDVYSKPEAFNESVAATREALTTEAAEQAEIEAQRAELEQNIARFESQVAEGHIKAANKANTKVMRLLETAKPTADQRGRTRQLQSKLQELKDWQGFATQPKRDELCEKMQSLAIDSAISMPEKAKAIKELQEQWRKLGSSDSRPAQRSWSRFKALGDQAYAPVSEYYAAQQAVRAEHLKTREALCEALEKFEAETDWDASQDWKALSALLQRTAAKWRQHGNVPRRNKKAIEKRFDAANKALRDRVGGEQRKHIEQKEALIEELKTKLEDEQSDTFALINRAKAAQQEWQKIGFVDRRKDQKLWKSFRAQCDAVFAKRDAQKQSERSEAKAVADNFRNVCKSFAAQLDSPFEKKDISAFRKEIAAIDLPRAHKGLEREATKLIKQAESELKNRARQNDELMFREFQNQCQQLDSGATPEADSSVTLSKQLQSALNNRSEKAIEEQDRLLIRLEILADLPSPEASQGARMQYQVERLNRELSQGQKEMRPTREQVRDLLIVWYSTSNKNSDWQSRFQTIATKLGIAV